MSELKKVKVISRGRNGNIRTDSNLDTIRTESLFYRLQWYRVPMIESDLLSYCRTLLLTKIFESLWQNSDLCGIGCRCPTLGQSCHQHQKHVTFVSVSHPHPTPISMKPLPFGIVYSFVDLTVSPPVESLSKVKKLSPCPKIKFDRPGHNRTGRSGHEADAG